MKKFLKNCIHIFCTALKSKWVVGFCVFALSMSPQVKADSSYKKATRYFQERNRPLRHFVDFGIGTHLINSFYPFEFTDFPLFIHLNYRREDKDLVPFPVMVSFQYEPRWKNNNHSRIYTLLGGRYPRSHDLKHFYVDLLLGISFSFTGSSKKKGVPLEIQLWFTHILGPRDVRGRLYLQWGFKARYQSDFNAAGALRMGIGLPSLVKK